MRYLLIVLALLPVYGFAEEWKPTAEMEQSATKVFESYIHHIQQSEFEKAYAMHTDAFKAMANYEEWKIHKSEFVKDAGKFITNDELKFTWYKDPQHAPRKGIYGAIDFKCNYENLGFCSGTLILYSQDGLEYQVMREEMNLLEKSIQQQLLTDGVIDESNSLVTKPFRVAEISEKQWSSYYTAANILLIGSKRVFPEQGLEVFSDKESGTMFAFTMPNHPAHPSWITRYLVEKEGAISVGQIGYFAGDEESFAELFRQYQELNQKIKQDMSN